MLGFVKARKWVDFVDKNLSQQTKNWDRFIDPPYSRAEHNLTCCVHDVYIYTYILYTQHIYTCIIHLYRTLCVCTRKAKAYTCTHSQKEREKHAVTNTLPSVPGLSVSLSLCLSYSYISLCVCILHALYLCVLAVLCQTESVQNRKKEVCTNTHEKLRTDFTELCYVTYILYIYECMWCRFFFTEHRKQVLIFGLFLWAHRRTTALTQCVSRCAKNIRDWCVCVCIRCLPV